MKKMTLALFIAAMPLVSFGADFVGEGAWLVKKEENKMTDQADVVAINRSPDVYTRQGIERSTSMVIRCKENKTEAYLSVSEYMGSDDPMVTIRLDGGKPQKRRWSGAEGGEAAFSTKPISFIKEISSHKKMIVGFEPYGSTMQVVEFDLTGIDSISKEISNACKWKS
ncbi:type VI secretion system-associated protein TagO [Klebsiella aerogenes]